MASDMERDRSEWERHRCPPGTCGGYHAPRRIASIFLIFSSSLAAGPRVAVSLATPARVPERGGSSARPRCREKKQRAGRRLEPEGDLSANMRRSCKIGRL